MKLKIIGFLVAILALTCSGFAQTNQVPFGKNRVQHNNLKWKFYQTENFNVYYYQNGEELAKQVAQMAEIELPQIENFTEYSLQRRANIVLYNTYDQYKQTNIGLNTDWVTSGGTTKLVNNKCLIYFGDNHAKLKMQVRTGIAKIITENIFFGGDLGEIARNQALLDLPPWLIEGYYNYVGESWNTSYDDDLRNEFLVTTYKNFYRFAYKKPELAGRAFWHYMDMKYKKENTTYFLYLARVFKNLNTASLKISGLKFKPLLKQLMAEMYETYDADVENRKSYVKGDNTIYKDVSDKKDFIRFAAHPDKNNDYYAVVEFTKGKYKVKIYDDYDKGKTLLTYGTRTLKADIHPNMPLLSWDTKGEYVACVYYQEGQIKLFIYDVIKGSKVNKQILKEFDQVQSLNYMPQQNTLLLCGMRNGQSDVYTYNMDTQTLTQITNDIYADNDATFVTFPNKTGIIYSSNRSAGNAINADTVLPANNKFNIFLVDNWNQSEFKQISQLTNIKNGEAKLPTQYNVNHFTFVCDENGIANRWAGFFKTEKAGLDTVAKIGNVILRNPSNRELDSVLILKNKTQPDSLYIFAITNDSSYVFPLTDYETSIRESKVAGNNDQVSEVNLEGKTKNLYKMKVDEVTLRRRNVNPRNTAYRSYLNDLDKKQTYTGELNSNNDKPKTNDVFQTEFDADTSKTISVGTIVAGQTITNTNDILNKSKKYPYLLKFSVDKIGTNLLSNEVIFNQFQPYGGGSGPIRLNNAGAFNGLFKASVYDVLEDYRITAAIRTPVLASDFTNVGGGGIFQSSGGSLLSGNSEVIVKAEYLKRRLDYTFTYYRNNVGGLASVTGAITGFVPARQLLNIYAGMVKYPFDEVKSLRFHAALRIDQITLKAGGSPPTVWPFILPTVDERKKYGLFKVEFVYDNVLDKAENIMNGLRYKAYFDLNTQLGQQREFDGTRTAISGKNILNLGFDARYYLPIYRNVIWASRASGDFSWGEQKMIYYIGGVDAWNQPRFNNNPPDPNVNYAFQTLAPNLRGHNQNVGNGNNNLVINTEVRCPVLPTLMDRPINNAFLRSFQVVTFVDFATAWTGKALSLTRPNAVYGNTTGSGTTVLIKPGGLGPFIGGYGYGFRGRVLGYFGRLDIGYNMNRFFKKPIIHLAVGVDF